MLVIFFNSIKIFLFRAFFALLLTFPALSFGQAPINSLVPVARQNIINSFRPVTFEKLLDKENISATVGYVLLDLDNSEVIEAINPSLQFPLASLSKVITALYGLETLGPKHKFETVVLITGTIENGILNGDLVLLGEGDPGLTNDHLVYLVEELFNSGLREVKGNFIVSSGYNIYHPFIDPDQPGYLSYNPSISGLNLNFNRVLFNWKYVDNKYIFDLEAKADINSVKVSTTDISFIKQKKLFINENYNGKNDKWYFNEAFLKKAKQRWLPVRNSEKYAAEIFWKFSKERGINIPKPVFQNKKLDGKVLSKIKSISLDKNIRLMLKYSNNLLAEVIGLTATKEITGKQKNLKVSAKNMQNWLESKIGKNQVKLIDHSGLGDGSNISSFELIKFLENSGWEGSVYNLTNDYEVKKTNSAILKNYTKKVKVKTGSLNFVSNIAGYIETKSGRRMAFAILTSNMIERNKLKKEDRDNPVKARVWIKKSRKIQLNLLEYWAFKYN